MQDNIDAFYTQVRDKLLSLDEAEANPDWEAFADKLDASDFDSAIKEKLDAVHPAPVPGDWDEFSDNLDVSPFDSLIREKLEDASVVLMATEVPGGGSDFSMCIVLPRERDGLHAVEQEIHPVTLQTWLTMRDQEVIVSLPRFQLELEYELNAPLESLGMKRAFLPDAAEFSGMTDDPEGLFIGSVLHKTFVDVNEQGTEAAAVTGVMMAAGCAMEPEPPKVFCADHPFLFLIRDRQTGWIYFMGRFNQPE